MGKNGRRKRRQQGAQRDRDAKLTAAGRRTALKQAEKPKNWFQRQHGGVQTLIVLGVTALVVAGHFVLWGSIFPALGAAVARVPVVSTVAGWLFGGGAFVAWGVFAINYDTAKPATVKRLRVVAWVWSAVAVELFPTGYANGISLPVDFWAGVYAGAYGVILTPVALGVAALGWWLLVNKLAGHKKEPSHQALGWMCVGYATLLLVWGSTLLRL
ncbi:hypothetical protein B0I31_101214 [Saccharothrix carnea]|uniref:Uncharacterized protein n=1 Tax=Saccharothrix carnea TaxID=1280637 RepID=A0A2P8IHQ6_SACCR|nr:hypothetical protein [Saccharothrix carnea]PSL58000.1 hypothetical protein B0I31_101214 [Saccharothrix carnea]